MNRAVLFLATPAHPHNDNHVRLPGLFRRAGWRVEVAAHDALVASNGHLQAGPHPVSDFDLIWPLGLGPRATFLDRIGLLRQIEPRRLVNSVDAYVYLHGKTAWLRHAPATVVAHAAAPLLATLEAQGGEWVLKPAAGSFGAGVQRVHTPDDIQRHLARHPPQYWLLQRFIPQIAAGETRTLICGNQIIGSYLRRPGPDLIANLSQGGTPAAAALAPGDRALVERVHGELMHAAAGFAAIDTVGGYVMEVNVANPGGLATLGLVYGDDFAAAAEQRLLAGIDFLLQRA